MGTLAEDARSMAEWVANALTQSGYDVDFSLESLREIDRFFEEHSRHGAPVPNGLLSEQLGSRMFAIGAYVGETVIRNHGGEWRSNDEDPEGEINIEIVLSNGGIIWPVQRVMKRFRNGSEDSVYVYGHMLAE